MFVKKRELTRAALAEAAAAALRALASQTSHILGNDAGPFDPDKALADPAALRGLASSAMKALRIREQYPKWYNAIPILLLWIQVFLIVALIAVPISAAYFSAFNRARGVGQGAGLAATACVGVSLVLAAVLLVAQNRCATAERTSSEFR